MENFCGREISRMLLFFRSQTIPLYWYEHHNYAGYATRIVYMTITWYCDITDSYAYTFQVLSVQQKV